MILRVETNDEDASKNCIGTRKRKRGERSSKQWCMVAKGRSNEPFRLKLKQAKEERSVRKGGDEGKASGGVINNSYQYTWGTEKRGDACKMGLPLYKLQVVVRE